MLKRKNYLILILVFVFINKPVWTEEKPETTVQPSSAEVEKKLLVNYSNGLLSVEAKSISVKDLFDEISKKTGIESFVDNIIKDKLTIKFENMNLKEGLEKIINSIGNKNYGLVYKKGEKGELEIGKVYLIKRGEAIGMEDKELAKFIEDLSEHPRRGGGSAYKKLRNIAKEKGKIIIPFIVERMKASEHLRGRLEFFEILEGIEDTSVIPELENILEDTKKYVTPYPVADMTGKGLGDGSFYGEMVNILNRLKFKKFIEEEKPYEKSINEQIYLWVRAYKEEKVVRGNAIHELDKIGPPALESLINLLKSEGIKANDKEAILFALRNMGEKIGFKKVLPLIIECLNEYKFQDTVLKILESIAEKVEYTDILQPVSKLLNDENDWIRGQAGRVLGKIGKNAISEILEIYDSLNIKGKKKAIEILGNIGDNRAINIIKEASNKRELKEVAEKALEQIEKRQKE